MHIYTDKIRILRSAINEKRAEWRDVKSLRLNKKKELLDNCYSHSKIRKEKHYKELNKKQKRLSKEIRHLEIKLNRIIAAKDFIIDKQ